MNTRALVGAAAAVALAFALSACASSGSTPAESGSTASEEMTPVIAPVTMDADDLQGATVDLVVGQVLNINTGDLAEDSYTGTVADTSVAEFVQGGEKGSATFNPGIKALAVGTTEVEMTNEQGGIQPLQFTVDVTER